MDIEIDGTRCQRYGQCALEAPDVFSLGDNGPVTVLPGAPESARPQVEAAADLCPMQAIALLE